MSDRKRAIETLKQLRLDYEEFYEERNNEVTQAYDMAISSLETDEAYQLEYEPTTKNDVPDINVGKIDYVSRKEVIEQCQEWRNHEFVTMTNPYYYLEKRLNNLISVTPLSSGLEKNSKKLEKNFGESDCISREQALRELKESAEHHANDSREEVLLRRDRDIIRALPAVTAIRPKGHWINKHCFVESWSCSAECSSCHKRSNGYIHDNGYGLESTYDDFCPKCGSDNREVKE